MDYYKEVPLFAVCRPCAVCDVELQSGEPAMVDYDSATDTGVQVTVQHVHCYRAVQTARAEAFAEAAQLATSYTPVVAVVKLQTRARQCAAALDVTVPR